MRAKLRYGSSAFVPVALVAMVLALCVLGGVAALARSSAPRGVEATPTLRLMMYETAPARSVAGRPASIPISGAGARVRTDLASLAWADVDGALVHWDGRGTASDQKLAALLAGIVSLHSQVRAAALIRSVRGSARARVRALARLRSSPGYLRIAGRPVVVVQRKASRRSCAEVRHWRAAAQGWWLAMAAFPGSARCHASADAWFRDTPVRRTAQVGDSFLIRPGYWPTKARRPVVTRSLASWRRSIQMMVASHRPLQLIDSFNDWAHGSAVAASRAWSSASGFGAYLDALHDQSSPVVQPPVVQPPVVEPPVVAPPSGAAAPPTVAGATVSGVTAHEATLTSVVSAGTDAAAMSVEFGPTAAYGQTTAPVTLAAGSAVHSVAITVSSLSAAVGYHARLVVSSAAGSVASSDLGFTTLPDTRTVRVAAAGDIACAPTDASFNGGVGTATACQQKATSDAIVAGGYDAVLPLGDTQYNAGTTPAFNASYRPSWGRVDAIAHPVVGNHEYGTPGAAQYFQYFGASAGMPGHGWYSYELGSWHVIALNANCALIDGGCGTGSPEETWLRADLASHPVQCTLAYWHQPLFTSGQEGPAVAMSTIWADLTSAGADLVLNGHEHDYERFAPQTATGQLDTAHGMPEIIAGTGGANHRALHKTRMPNSVTSDSTSFGFLDLALNSGAYSWNFVPVAGGTFHDSGTASCR